ncbi:MAG: hypothetical protein J0L78_04505 [Planctomycetes bacterium]|nr:hypothetical protein [Planctomycetota bacterium]
MANAPMLTATPPTVAERDRLIALGRTARSWEFLAAAGAGTGDPGLALLAASHLAKLGLKTLALEAIAALPEQVREAPEIRTLVRGIEALPNDAIERATLLTNLGANRAALGDRLHGRGDAALPTGAAVFRASDGNLLARVGGQTHFVEHKSASMQILAEHRTVWEQNQYQAFIVAGVRSHWLTTRACRARGRDKLGYRAPIYLIEPDADRFVMAMAMENIAEELADGHVRAFVGQSAASDFAAFLRERIDLRISGTLALDPGAPPSVGAEVAAYVRSVIDEQERETTALEQRVRGLSKDRDAAWWRDRFADTTRPLRVLIPTSRYSTFVQHSSRDIASAFASLGHEARVLIEPDDSSCLAAGATLRALHDYQPDLVVCINYPRSTIGAFVPPNIPWVCWIQDLMPHLFDERVGRGLTDLDFTIGHLKPALHDRYGYPRESSLALPVPASERKFFVSEATDSDRARFECEIAYVSHQSETPGAQHERIVKELLGNQTTECSLIRALPALRDAVHALVRLPLSTQPFPSMKSVVVESLTRSMGGTPPDHVVDRLIAGYADPLADRIVRHQTLEWAAEAARRNGWRFHLYGRGWENHPTLAPFAKGPLGHDGDLKLCYQLAGCHLQVTYHMLAHPRLGECVLSGGIPLCRLHWEEIGMIRRDLVRGAQRAGASTPSGDGPTLDPGAEASRLGRMTEILRSVDCPDGANGDERTAHGGRLEPEETSLPSAFGMIGEQTELFFHDAGTLEARVRGLLDWGTARESRNAVARRRIEANHTYHSAMSRVLQLIRSRLGAVARK